MSRDLWRMERVTSPQRSRGSLGKKQGIPFVA